MTDGELRGIVLEKFYELRHEKDVLQLPDIDSFGQNEPIRIANICEQLGQHGLIEWQTSRGLDGFLGGLGKITANGVDVIEGTARSPITVTLHDQRISISSSSNVQIGNSNTQGVTLNVGKFIAAVDHSNASEAEKKEAKSLLERVAANPLVQKILAAGLAAGRQTSFESDFRAKRALLNQVFILLPISRVSAPNARYAFIRFGDLET